MHIIWREQISSIFLYMSFPFGYFKCLAFFYSSGARGGDDDGDVCNGWGKYTYIYMYIAYGYERERKQICDMEFERWNI